MPCVLLGVITQELIEAYDFSSESFTQEALGDNGLRRVEWVWTHDPHVDARIHSSYTLYEPGNGKPLQQRYVERKLELGEAYEKLTYCFQKAKLFFEQGEFLKAVNLFEITYRGSTFLKNIDRKHTGSFQEKMLFSLDKLHSVSAVYVPCYKLLVLEKKMKDRCSFEKQALLLKSGAKFVGFIEKRKEILKLPDFFELKKMLKDLAEAYVKLLEKHCFRDTAGMLKDKKAQILEAHLKSFISLQHAKL